VAPGRGVSVSSTCDRRGRRGPGEGVHRRRGGSKHQLWRGSRILQAAARAQGERGAGLERVWEEREKGEAGLGLGSYRGKGRRGGACRRADGMQSRGGLIWGEIEGN
jgi:hypothetical protein